MGEVGILDHQDRVELIDGEILHMSPIGSKHQGIINILTNLFVPLFLNKAIVQVQGPIKIANFSEPEPDVLLLKPRADFYTKKHAQAKDTLLLIEVADSSLEFDKEIKLPIYAKAKIKEYWIINLKDDQIEIYRSPKDGIYKSISIAKVGDKISCLAFPKKSIPVKNILG